jgi:hypothetical protein
MSDYRTAKIDTLVRGVAGTRVIPGMNCMSSDFLLRAMGVSLILSLGGNFISRLEGDGDHRRRSATRRNSSVRGAI